MATRRRFGKKLFRLLVPILLVLAVALLIALVAIVYGITRPPRRSYLVTPATFSTLSGTGKALKVTEETWTNRDRTAGARLVVARRRRRALPLSFCTVTEGTVRLLLNLGMKVNEATGCTILWPDLRAHGLNPSVQWTSIGTREGDDVLAAIDFLRSLKGADKHSSLIGDRLGIYGVELERMRPCARPVVILEFRYWHWIQCRRIRMSWWTLRLTATSESKRTR
jgi:hypothetical protein